MIRLYSYPELFGVADNNPFGLKVFAFLKLSGLAFEHEHIFDASGAPRSQLPYIVDDGQTIGDSDPIIAHLIAKHRLSIDGGLTEAQRDTGHMIRRMLDGLYWIMSYSRWRDPEFWPLFRDAMLERHPQVTAASMDAARSYNFERYRYQGIGRFEPAQVYDKGSARSGRPRPSARPPRLPVRLGALCHRRGGLRFSRQHPFLRHRHAASALPQGPGRAGAPYRAAACPRHGLTDGSVH